MLQQQQLKERLDSLQKEFEIGQGRLRELEKEESYVRETLLRISGAMQVLKELLHEATGRPDAQSSEIDFREG